MRQITIFLIVLLSLSLCLSVFSLVSAEETPKVSEKTTVKAETPKAETSSPLPLVQTSDDALCYYPCACAIQGAAKVEQADMCVCKGKCSEKGKTKVVVPKKTQAEVETEEEKPSKPRTYKYVLGGSGQIHSLGLSFVDESKSLTGYRLEGFGALRFRLAKYFIVEPSLAVHKSNLGGGFSAGSAFGLAAFKNPSIVAPLFTLGYQLASEGKGYLTAIGGEYELKSFILGGVLVSEHFDGWVFHEGQDWKADSTIGLRGYMKYQF